MIYRCRLCDHEVMAGCLPTVTCGLYFVFLLNLSFGCMAGAVYGIRFILVGDRPGPAEPAKIPLWGAIVLMLVGVAALVGIIVGMVVIKYLLELAEYLAFVRWQQCPQCGGRSWTRGFTRGFGL
jgi:hypothetical protein